MSIDCIYALEEKKDMLGVANNRFQPIKENSS
jgi:hypothetical protein